MIYFRDLSHGAYKFFLCVPECVCVCVCVRVNE